MAGLERRGRGERRPPGALHPAARPRRGDRGARRLQDAAPPVPGRRGGPPARALQPAGRRRPERAPARADEGALGRSSSARSSPSVAPPASCGASTRSRSRSPRASRSRRRSTPSREAMVELLDADVAVIRMPDPAQRGADRPRGPRRRSVARRRSSPRSSPRPQPLSAPLARRLLRSKRAVDCSPRNGRRRRTHTACSSRSCARAPPAAVLPLATPGEVLGTLTVVSFDPARPLERGGDRRRDGRRPRRRRSRSTTRASTSSRRTSPRRCSGRSSRASFPASQGLEVGHVYQSSARVDVGGDLYDFVLLEDGRLAVVIGDVLGKGISAAADMAMAKYIFRVLARSDADPAALPPALRTTSPATRSSTGSSSPCSTPSSTSARARSRSASAGHPPARVVEPGGRVVAARAAPGLPLGIEPDQEYAAGARAARARLGRRPLHGRRRRGPARRRALRRGTARPPPRRARATSRPRSWRRRSWPTAGPSPAASSTTTAPSSASSWHAEPRDHRLGRCRAVRRPPARPSAGRASASSSSRPAPRRSPPRSPPRGCSRPTSGARRSSGRTSSG